MASTDTVASTDSDSGTREGGSGAETATCVVIMVLLLGGTYATTLDNPFVFDSLLGIRHNNSVRDRSRIPQYFVDGRTLTPIRFNAGYRPILQTTYALNHAWSGYEPWSWHLVNLFGHVIVCLGILAIARRLFGSRRLRDVEWITPEEGDRVALGAMLLFAVHPMVTGCVNYLWARSSLLVAVWILPATALELSRIGRPGRWTRVFTVGLYALAIFTKIEAISFVGVIFLMRILLARDPVPTALKNVAPFLFVTAIYLVCRWSFMPLETHEFRDTGPITPWTYFLTQTRVLWDYLSRIAAPYGFVLDDASHPLAAGPDTPGVMRALLGWVLVLSLIGRAWTRQPEIAFLALTWFVHLAPHSSIVPILQMSNEHRPYLATGGPVILVSAFLMTSGLPASRRSRIHAIAISVLVLGLAHMTRLRNRIWDDPITLWTHVAGVRPGSSRAHLNRGWALKRAGRDAEAHAAYERALRLEPDHGYGRTLLGLLHAARGEYDEARVQFNEAVRLSEDPTAALLHRGRFLRQQGEPAAALRDLEQASRLSPEYPGLMEELDRLRTPVHGRGG